MAEKYSDNYAQWLENALFNILTSSKNSSIEKMIKKLDAKGIKCHDKFIEYSSNKFADIQIISKLPLLNTYPTELSADVYEDDIEKINEWEIKTITKLFIEFEKRHKGQNILNFYDNFFNREIKPYKEYFLYETYEKLLPVNITRYWNCRIDTTIPWNEMYKHPENYTIDLTSVLESEYLKIEKSMSEFDHLIGRKDVDVVP